MNPYDFVRLNWEKPPQRSAPATHERFRGLTGSLNGRIRVLTPFFLPDKRSQGDVKEFLRNSAKRPIIPGSSLKGLLRSVVETTAPGCWWLFDGLYERRTVDYSGLLPAPFRQCSDSNNLCPACRMFGMLARRGGNLLGKVCCEEAVCVEEKPHEAVCTPILDGPKPRHRAWYLDQGRVAGRKFYFHQTGIQTLGEIRRSTQGVPMNTKLRPLDRDSVFDFTISFSNVEQEVEWPQLLFAVCLQEGMAHKFGYAKPAGFGSVKIELQNIHLFDPASRYASNTAGKVVAGEELQNLVREQTAWVASRMDPESFTDLKRIWQWPPPPGVSYRYPGQPWFKENPGAPLSKAP